jgi:3-deoxy-D-manno-octulosonic-acid transferase
VRRLYDLIAYALAPIYCGALLWRGIAERGYWQHFRERFGFGPALAQSSLWLHASSAGEVQACVPLARALRRTVPDAPLVLTTSTPAGAARARALLLEQRVEVRYVPLDLPGAVRRFLVRARPRLAIVLETELWPNLYEACARRGIPLALASARMSARSARRYGLLRGPIARALASCELVAAQTEADAARFIGLGAPADRTRVVGNLKFDLEVPGETLARGRRLRERHAAGRPVWVAGSTHQGEESVVLEAHERVREVCPNALLVLAPRHPPRFAEVGALLERRAVRFVRRSRDETCDATTEVLLLDSLGELLDVYAAADVTFVGGSLVPVGGHNLLEPAALARPIVAGPHLQSVAQSAHLLRERRALEIAHDARELAERVARLLANREARAGMGERARTIVLENRGTLARLVALIEPLLARARPESRA